jgi:hypothetical protein
MKTLIATAILALASSAASADYLSVFNGDEFYRGQDDSRLVTKGLASDSLQFQEGNYAAIMEPDDSLQGDRIGHVQPDSPVYIEGTV